MTDNNNNDQFEVEMDEVFTMDNILLENENYMVQEAALSGELPLTYNGVEYSDYYAVINRATGNEELLTPVLPEALANATNWDAALKYEVHKGIYKQYEMFNKEEEPDSAIQVSGKSLLN